MADLADLTPGYSLKRGSRLDRPALLKFMRLTYAELFPAAQLGHLDRTVESYFSGDTPIWWIQHEMNDVIGCLWMGVAIEQSSGIRHAHVFLLYVKPQHRRRGIAKWLMSQAEDWAKHRGDRQIGLQVFTDNRAAIGLYESLGYQTQAVSMMKYFD
jgi:ribosomal protein S18 acetylase RimI-like enzyme